MGRFDGLYRRMPVWAQHAAVSLYGVYWYWLRFGPGFRRARKWGFGVPWTRYLRGIPELRDAVERLPEAEPIRYGPFDAARVRDTARRFLAGEDELALLVRQLVLVTVWHEAAFHTAPESATAEARRSG